jgi:glutamate/tyrosine decarboxylase-like PLP-dependent enzyme
LIHLGFNGFRSIMENTLANARLLSRALEHTGWFRCVSDIHRKKGDLKFEKGKKAYDEGENSAAYNAGLPVVAFTLTDDFKKDYPHVKQESVSNTSSQVSTSLTAWRSGADMCRLPAPA